MDPSSQSSYRLTLLNLNEPVAKAKIAAKQHGQTTFSAEVLAAVKE